MPQPKILDSQLASGGTPDIAGITSGTVTLTAGQGSVSNSAILSSSVVSLSFQTYSGNPALLTALSVNSLTTGSFQVLTGDATDSSSVVAWTVIN